jgi:hypothetical protein
MTVCQITRTDPRCTYTSSTRGSRLHRRHLTTSQRAMIAARLTNLRDGQNARWVEAGSWDPASSVTIDECRCRPRRITTHSRTRNHNPDRGRHPRGRAGHQGTDPTGHNIFTAAHQPGPGPDATARLPPYPLPPAPGRGAGCPRDMDKPAPRPHTNAFASPSFGRFLWDSGGNVKIVHRNRP